MKETSSVKTNKKFVPFEKSNVLSPLKLFFVIVPYGQQPAIQKYLVECEVSASFTITGEGTGSKDSYEMLGLSDSKKQIVCALVRADRINDLKEKLVTRFNISPTARGIAFSIKVSSIAGVSVYKFLTNSRILKRRLEK